MFCVSYYLHQSSEIGDLSSTQSSVVTFTAEPYIWCVTSVEKCLLYSQVRANISLILYSTNTTETQIYQTNIELKKKQPNEVRRFY